MLLIVGMPLLLIVGVHHHGRKARVGHAPHRGMPLLSIVGVLHRERAPLPPPVTESSLSIAFFLYTNLSVLIFIKLSIIFICFVIILNFQIYIFISLIYKR